MIAALVAALLLATAPVSPSPYNPDAEIVGAMDFDSLSKASDDLGAAVSAGKKDLTLRISSPGGEVLPTLLFVQMTRDMLERNGAHIMCVGDIMVASAAALLLESPVCSRRVVTTGTVLLFHGVRGQIGGTVREMEDEIQLYRDLDKTLASVIAPRLGMTEAAYLAMIDGHDVWWTPAEALAHGAVDEVLYVRPLPAEPDTSGSFVSQ